MSDSDRTRLASLGSSVLRLMNRVRSPSSSRSRIVVSVFSLLLFAVIVGNALRSLPDLVDPDLPTVLVLVAVATPVTAWLNALEFQVIARSVGQHLGLVAAARVTLVASVANFLPAPGAFVVRSAALTHGGASIRSAASINLLTSGLWFGLTMGVAGIAYANESIGAGLGLLAAGAAIASLCAWRVRIRARAPVIGRIVAIELGTIAMSSVRTWLAFRALGVGVSGREAVIIGTAQVIAAAIGIAPGGLGLRELVAAGLAKGVGVDRALTIAATAVDRAAAQVGYILLAVVLIAAGVVPMAQVRQRFGMRPRDTPDGDDVEHAIESAETSRSPHLG